MAEIPSYLAPNVAPEVPQQAAVPNLAEGGPSESVYDIANKAPLDIPHSEFEIAVRSGQYAPLATKEYVVKDANGSTHRVKGSNLKTVFDEGSTLASVDESSTHMNNFKYGNQELAAGIEGISRGFLPGVSDKVLMASDSSITQEDLAGRAAANPISAGIGEAIGSAGLLLSPAGKATVGVGAAKASTALAKLGSKAGFSNKIAQAIVSKVIPAAAGSAVEGAFFGAAHLLNEDALGTAQFNAENLLSSVEQGALWGAAFGGGLSALGSATSSTSTAFAESRAGKYLGNKVKDLDSQFNNKKQATYEFLGITPAKANKLSQRDPEFIDDAVKWTGEVLTENPRAGVAEVAAKATADLDSVGKQIGALHDDVEAVLASKKMPAYTSEKQLKMKIASRLDDEILPNLDGVVGSAAEIKMVNREINEMFDAGIKAEGNVLGVKELHSMMKKVDAVLFKDKQQAQGALTLRQQMLKVQRETIREELNNAVADAAKAFPTELAGSAEALKQLNRRFRTITSLESAVKSRAFGDANQSFLKGAVDTKDLIAASIDPLGGAAMVIGKKFLESDMLRKMKILGKIEKYQQQTSSAIQSGLKTFASGVRSTKPLISQSLVSSAVATELVEGKKKKPQDEQQAYRNIVANARQASENPEQFLQSVNRYSSHLYTVAPKTSGALDTAALNAMVFLHSKAPKSTKNKGFFDAGKVDKVNGAEMLKMQQRIDMITTPSKAFQLLGNGKLGATHVETIKAVYPSLYSDMQKQSMEFLSGPKASKLTYGQKLNMSMLLDIKADESMHFSSVLALQSNFAPSEQDDDGGVVGTTQGGLANVDKADRVSTSSDNDE